MTLLREEQARARAGRITGSAAQRIMTAVHRTTWNTIAKDLRNPKPFYSVDDTPNMPAPLAWGQIHEAHAAGHFWERHPEYDVHQVPFLHWHDPTQLEMLRYYGFSPDRMLTRPGHDRTWKAGLEIKCPFDNAVHTVVLRERKVPDWCIWQIYHGMYVSNLREWWFVCYDPRPDAEEWRYFELAVPFEQWRMDKLKSTLREFLDVYSMGDNFTPRSLKAADLDRMF